jgi:hypothetical protein
MTLARSILQPFHFQVNDELFPEVSKPEKPLVLMSYPVTLHKIGGSWNEFKIGHVVTYLDLDDWCLMKGFRLVGTHKGTRRAAPTERTDLF